MPDEVDLAALERELSATCEAEQLDEQRAPGWAVHGRLPRLVCRPATAEALAAALAGCDRAGAAVIPWGGGTQQRLGLPPRRADVVLSTRALKRLVAYEPADLTATVEAGMCLVDLQALLGEHGQWLPLDPPLKPQATIGGLLATNPSGPRRLRDGSLRDLVIGTRVAAPDGKLARAGGRVVKNVTGYDLNKLHLGALGTLGVLVEVSFKVAPRPETERSWLGVFRTAAAAGKAIAAIRRRPLAPSALEVLGGNLAGLVGLALPPGHWALLARASGFRPAVERHLVEFAAAGTAAGAVEGEVLAEGRAESLWSAYADAVADLRWAAAVLTCRLAVPPAAVGALGDEVSAVGERPFVWAQAAGALFWSIGAAAAGQGLVGRLRALAEGAGGRLVVENWPPTLAGLDVWGHPAGPLDLMRALKKEYDPRGTLNPGRFVGDI